MKAIFALGVGLSLATSLQVFAPGPMLPAWGQRLGWTLVHSIWQVGLVAALAWFVLVTLRRQSARLRYSLAVTFLGVMLILPAVTWSTVTIAEPAVTEAKSAPAISSLPPFDAKVSATSGPQVDKESLVLGPAPSLSDDRQLLIANETSLSDEATGHSTQPSVAGRSWFERAHQSVRPWLRLIVAIWLAGVFFCAIRPIVGLWTQWRLQHVGLSAVAEQTQRLMIELARRMKVSPAVRVAESALVTVPMVVGYLRPIILLPASVMIGMTPDQLESLLAHELAHIRRHDWIVNAAQVVIETLMFYHPAIWWLSKRIRFERELCCDDLALAVIGDKATYGRMLLALEELRHQAPTIALAATGGELVQRIRRLLPTVASAERAGRGWLAGTLVLGCLAAVFIGWLTTSASDARPQDAPKEPPTEVTEKQLLVDEPQNQKILVRGRVVTADQSPLPKDLKLQKRITGSNFAENPKDVSINERGEFSIEIDRDAAFVRLYATSSEFAPGSTPRFEVKRGQPVDPVVITLPRGSTARVRLQSESGEHPTSGTAKVTLRNTFEPQLGTFDVDSKGFVTITHCPDEPVQIDLLMAGFEEQRIHQKLVADKLNEVTVRTTASAIFRVVDADGKPIAGALARLYSRIRSDSFMKPRTEWGDGPVWGVSGADGHIVLITLCATDPIPTNVPAPADYVFRIDAPGQAPYYVGPIRAGSRLGDIQLSKALRVEGEIIRDAEAPERVSVQWRQATVEQGAATGKGVWTTAKLEEADGQLRLKLAGLKPGPFDLYITYSDPKVPADTIGGTIKQLEFHGVLTNSSLGLKISRDAVTPGDSHLVATRASLFPIDEMPPSNLPAHAVRQFDAGTLLVSSGDEADTVVVANERPRLKTLLTWSHTAPVQHSMGYVNWHVIVLDDGTVIVPPSSSSDIGAHYKLPPGELRLLIGLLNKHADLWDKQVAGEAPEQGGWRHGSESLVYNRDGKPRAFHSWDVEVAPLVPHVTAAKQEITDRLQQLIVEAKCGGRANLSQYRDLANQALQRAFPTATPYEMNNWTSASIESDGSRWIDFGNSTENSRVSLVHPIGGQPYVEYVEFHNQRAAANPPEVGNAKTGPLMIVKGVVEDEAKRPIPHADVVLGLVNTVDSEEQTQFIDVAQADANGRYVLELPDRDRHFFQRNTKVVVWGLADSYGIGIVSFRDGSDFHTMPLPRAQTVEIATLDESDYAVKGQITRLDLDSLQIPPQFLKRMVVPGNDGQFEIRQMPRKFANDELDTLKLRKLWLQTTDLGRQMFMWRTDTTKVREGHEPVVLKCRSLAKLQGQLTASDGEVPGNVRANVIIEVETINGDSSMKEPWCFGHATVMTDALGHFDLQIPTGKLQKIRTHLPPGTMWRSLLENREEINLQAGDNPSIRLPLVATRKLRGTVVRPNGERIPDIELTVSHGAARSAKVNRTQTSSTSEYREKVMTDADGRFAIDVVPGDLWVLWQFVAGSNVGSSDLWPDQNPPPIEMHNGNMLRIPSGKDPFILPPITLTSYEGTIVDESGQPVAAVLFAGGTARGMTHSDAKGRFTLNVLGSSPSWIAARDEDTGDFGFPRESSPPVTVISESPLVLQLASKGATNAEQQDSNDDSKAAEVKKKQPWSVHGRVVDGDGKPVKGAYVWASTGMGSLRIGGSGQTDEDGKYAFNFGPGISFTDPDHTQLQAASIMVRKEGFFEKNLSRQGDLLMARKLPDKVEWGKKTLEDVILPDKPRQVDFVLLPAAHLAGTLIDDQSKPLAGYRLSLQGNDLPPSSSVVASTKSDEKGKFKMTEIPTGFKYQILVEPPKAEPPWNAWASGAFDFRVSSGDDIFVQEPDREVAANLFELQIKGEGLNWRAALKAGAKCRHLEPTGDYLTSDRRLHAASIRLTLDPKELDATSESLQKSNEK